MYNAVDFPHPEGPSKLTNSASLTSNDVSLNACTAPEEQ
jgi:hypothetical protein